MAITGLAISRQRAFTKVLILIVFGIFCVNHLRGDDSRLKIRSDDDWKFSLGDSPDFFKPGFNGSAWRAVTLPHDWSIEQHIDPAATTGGPGGYYPTGIGCYRYAFTAPPAWRGKQVQVEFEGVYMDADIYLNGQKLYFHPYGYTSFFVNLTPALQIGSNLLAVRVDNSRQKNTRFYSGSGINRHVWLEVTNPVHVANWGAFVATTKAGDGAATLQVHTGLQNDSDEAVKGEIESDVIDPQGHTVAKSTAEMDLPAKGEKEAQENIDVANPALWFPETPQLYRLVSRVRVEGREVDNVTTSFGIRKLAWSVTDGFTINGRSYKMKGGCVHQDNGVLGACAFDRAEERKVQILKAAGYNAIRTAHNPPSPSILAACDRLGMMVMDESFDCWGAGKNKQDYSVYFKDWWQTDLTSMIMRDRNHPSVVIWSIGNEVPDVFGNNWAFYAPEMAGLIRSLDSTRPVTNAVVGWPVGSKPGPNDAVNRKNADDLVWGSEDIVGTNYRLGQHLKEHDRHPDRILISTESYPPLGMPKDVLSHSFVVGDFVWTAMEYLGESGLGRWFFEGDPTEALEPVTAQHPKPGPVGNQSDKNYPWHGSPSGNIDLIGNRKTASHQWNISWDAGEKLYLAVRQPTGGKKIIVTGWGWSPLWDSWTWPGCEGQKLEVQVYSRYPNVRLYLNDQLLGEHGLSQDGRFETDYQVPYTPGVLKAVGVQDGQEVESCQLHTTGDAARVRLTPDLTSITADGQGLSFVKVEVVDKDGNIQPNADQSITFVLTGPGTIAGLGNADLKDPTPYQGTQCRVFHGRALVVLRSTRQPGTLKLSATSKGLSSSSAEVETKL
jgi:beta-galactosidase